ncbi:class I SAM-dependent methyltransferase [Pandoraea sputorum]|nr:class I SAM-dependent methyltransferase [Pandoraea sputorum]
MHSIMSIRAGYDTWSTTYDNDENITRDLDSRVTEKQFANQAFQAVIDCGCGTGKNIPFFAARAESVLGMDFSAGMIGIARQKEVRSNVAFLEWDISQPWPVDSASHDLISCNLVLQHVERLDAVFAQVRRCLKPGGRFFISELHPIKKYQGSMARYVRNSEDLTVPAFDHQISHFLQAARQHQLRLVDMDEAWHDRDAGRPPRLVTFLFEKI